MNENTAPPDLRYFIRQARTGFGNPNALANVNTNEYPNGAACYVIDDAAFWVLDKTSTQAALSGYVVTPGAGPGRWFRQQTSETLSPPVQMIGAGTNAFAIDGNWGISSSSNFSLLSLLVPDRWTLTALGGVLTYTGKPATFMCQALLVAQVGNADAAREVFAVISKNNDFTGAAALSTVSTSQTFGTASVNQQISAQRMVQLDTNDTLRIKLAGPAAATSLNATQVSLIASPV